MISDAQLPELNDFRKLERVLPVEFGTRYSQLVAANGNEDEPVHRWFRFKESFSGKLLGAILKLETLGLQGRVNLLDPFCGVGTTLVSAQRASNEKVTFRAVGIERNPFIAFVARTKSQWPVIDSLLLSSLQGTVLAKKMIAGLKTPPLSSLTTQRCMSRHVVKRLLSIRNRICELEPSPVRDALLLGLAASIEPLSKVRKDGRALRLVTRGRRLISSTLEENWNRIASDCKTLNHEAQRAPEAKVLLGDGRALSSLGIADESIDLVLTSPPYPNNIDYSEVYKLELWLLGFVGSSTEFLKLRKSTFRSHPTSDLATAPPEFTKEIGQGKLKLLFDPMLARTEASPEKWRHRLLLGYFSDIRKSLAEQHRGLRKNGRAIIVVGNSLHGGRHLPYLVPTDLAVAIIAQETGFQVESLQVARNLLRRLSGNHFLRESVIVLRKPDA